MLRSDLTTDPVTGGKYVTTILKDNRITHLAGARVAQGDLWLPAHDWRRIVDEAPPNESPAPDGTINVSAHWRSQQRPVLSNSSGDVFVLGAGAHERAQVLKSLQAPDFTLPDLDGTPHSLSDFRGKKVFLASWSSW
jgi:hypothetical protein